MDSTQYDEIDRPFWVDGSRRMTGPTVAGIYDALLGGGHNTERERCEAEKITVVDPRAPLVAQTNRAFLNRAVGALAQMGVRQFIDLGSGFPTQGSVHEVAQAVAPDARVVYVDIDPVAVAFARELLLDNPNASAIPGDLRRPDQLLFRLTDPRLPVDLNQPAALLMVAVLHFEHDTDPYALVEQYVRALRGGSFLVFSHLAKESFGADEVARVRQQYAAAGQAPPVVRTHDEVARFFDGLEMVEPGLVYAPQWRPTQADVPWEFPDDARRSGTHVGVGCKTGQAGG
ncbi:SAM-dependent methyltransferase [Micromonospora sp. CPCC 206061]|uniref:SAM-dependent methyltransferase n=1 Tax=Micromonospora sp. CPCC 206061 TaxID=3122410 RepID=UPI002FEF5CB0